MDQQTNAAEVKKVEAVAPVVTEVTNQLLEGKNPLYSKTLWISAITALAPLGSASVGIWIASHPALFSAAMGFLFAALRLVTKERVVVK